MSMPLTKGSAAGKSIDDRVSRLIDIFLSMTGLIFLFPLFVCLSILIVLDDPGPVLYRPIRIGRDGKRFTCLKFRTMKRDAEAQLQELLAISVSARREWELDHKLRDDPRITGLGAFLRKSSLDELPQLWNVLIGEMSLVGPRPIVDAEVRRYGRHFHFYCSVRPGMTGLWQVSGRNNVSYRKRVAFDVAYARRHCALLNLKILLATLPAVLLRRGAY
jgi:lipopolysaccharide/colanic/teichoic acid biosynthesis glycosyltransferase